MVQARSEMPATIHASALVVEGHGVLVRGASGSGKSSLVLALLLAEGGRNRLVADDRVVLTAAPGRLLAAPPPQIAGLLEVRGLGVVVQPFVPKAEISLVVDLERPELCPRLPTPDEATVTIEGVVLRRLVLPVGQADGWMRVLAALRFAPAAL